VVPLVWLIYLVISKGAGGISTSFPHPRLATTRWPRTSASRTRLVGTLLVTLMAAVISVRSAS